MARDLKACTETGPAIRAASALSSLRLQRLARQSEGERDTDMRQAEATYLCAYHTQTFTAKVQLVR